MMLLGHSAGSWEQHVATNCYQDHGGTPTGAGDTPLASKSIAECEAACEANSNCAAVVRVQNDSGDCWLRSKVNLESCDKGAGYDTFVYSDAPSPSPSPSWAFNGGLNCYSGHGGTPVTSEDVPLSGKDVAECEAACSGEAACVAVVRVHGQASGDCWLRASVEVDKCQQSEGYDTFVHTGSWPPSPPNPPPVPCCDGYVNNFNMSDNAFGARLPSGDVRANSFAFLIADYGLATGATSGGCCQQDVADLMREKRAELEAQGKKLVFMTGSGDNFYWTGLNDKNGGGAAQWARWNAVYDGLNDVPWLASMGNHDLGDSDIYATCPDKASKATIGGQAYGSNQLDEDKGGYRAGGNDRNYHMPDFNYRYTLDALNLEIYAVDQNYVDVGGIGGDAGGHAKRNSVCGGEGQLTSRLQTVGHSGEQLLRWGAAKGAHDKSQKRNVLILQHYPGLCKGLADDFAGAAPEAADKLDVRCSFGTRHHAPIPCHLHHTPSPRHLSHSTTSPAGHTHETICETGKDADCASSMVGGGGGCCDGDVTGGGAGYGLLTFLDGGMNVELIRLGKNCALWPSAATAEEVAQADRFADEHKQSYAADKAHCEPASR